MLRTSRSVITVSYICSCIKASRLRESKGCKAVDGRAEILSIDKDKTKTLTLILRQIKVDDDVELARTGLGRRRSLRSTAR
jgi:hypothetical protein